MVERYDKAKARLDEVTNDIERLNAKRVELKRFVNVLKTRDSLLTKFVEELWNTVIDRVVVKSRELVVFVFRDGSEVEWPVG